jgi:hypothetical protein
VTLLFRADTDGSLNSNWFLDDVAWQSSPATPADDPPAGDALADEAAAAARP